MQQYKTVTIPAWAEAMNSGETGRDKINSSADAYARVPLILRAARLRVNSLRRVPLYVGETPAEETEQDIYYPIGRRIGLKDLVGLLELSLLLKGGALVVDLRNGYGFGKGWQFVNPFTVYLDYDKNKRATTAYQLLNGERFPQGGVWTDGDDCYFLREFNPKDDVAWGVSAAENALGSAQLMFYLERFSAKFFESGAMPLSIVPLPQGTPEGEVKRVESFFRRAMTGIANAWRVLGIRTQGDKFNPFTFTPNFKDMALPDVRNSAIDAVSWSFDVPRTMLTADAANYATATSDFDGFLTQTIIPRCDYYTAELKRMGMEDVRFAPEEMTEMQADENERATAFSAYCGAGMDKRVAAAILGIDIPEDVQDIWEAQGEAADEARENPPEAQPQPGQEQPPAQGDEDKQAEAKAFKRWYAKRENPDPSKFQFKHLTAEQQAALIAEAQGSDKPADPFKAIATISNRFEQLLTGLVNEAWNSGQPIRVDMRLLVRRYVEDAYFEGLLENGASPDQLSDADRQRIDDLIADQEQYITKFAQDVHDAYGDALQQQQIRRRIALWAESVEKAGNEGQVAAMATRGEKLQWHTNRDELVCAICGPLNNKIVNAGEPFGMDGRGKPIYSEPAHPNCRCTATRWVD